jgi:ribosomal protein S18 acetylase RimI-like enzyme
MALDAEALDIRPATADDAALIHRLTLAAYAEYRGVLVPESGVFAQSAADVRADIDRGGAIIARLAGEPVGCGRWELPADRSHLYVGRLAVLPAFRGRGIASRMLAWCEAHAVALGLPEVQLGVRLQLPRNRALYERLGYETFGFEDRPGYGRTSAWMRKRVGGGLRWEEAR